MAIPYKPANFSFEPNMSTVSGPSLGAGNKIYVNQGNKVQPGGSVLGLDTSKTPPYTGPTSTPQQPTSSGGSSKSGSNKSSGPSDNDILKEIQKAYDAKINFLKKAQGTLSSNLKGVEEGIGSLYNENKASLDQQYGEGERMLTQQEAQGGLRLEDAQTSARRLYNELLTSGQQRFGGASSAGEAYQSLAGTELQRNNQAAQSDFSNFMTQVASQKTSLKEKYSLGLQNLESQKTRMVMEARRDFQNKLLEIDRMKADAAGDKSNKRLAALQDLRNQMFQINLAASEGKQYLDSMLQQNQSEIDAFAQQSAFAQNQGQQAYGEFEAGVPTDYETQYGVEGEQVTPDQLSYQGLKDEEDVLSSYGFNF